MHANRNYLAAAFLGVTMSLTLGCDDSMGPPTPATGSIHVVILTSGLSVNLDPDGYTLSVDGGAAQAVPVNTGVLGMTIPGVSPGPRLVRLDGLAPNCTVSGTNPRSVAVVAGVASLTVSFSVTCIPKTGSIRVTTITTGPSQDADGYSVQVAGIVRGNVSANATTIISGVQVGRYEVVLTGVSVNCAVDGPNSRSVDVTLGGTTEVSFAITCVAASGLRVTTITTGVDLDPNGFILNLQRVGASTTSAFLPANGTTFIVAFAGEYRLTVLGVMANCDLVGQNLRTVTVTAGSESPVAISVTCAEPAQLVFETSTFPTIDRPDIYAVDSDGRGLSRLTTEPGKDLDPAWSQDGSRIAFASDRDGNLEIYVMNRDGTNQVRLTTSAGADYRPAWSPDGARIAFVSERDGNPEIYVMKADGTNPLRLTTRNGLDLDPNWSPDGTRIAFASDRDGSGGIWTMNADGSGVSRVTSDVLADRHPDWSPDGKMIVFSRKVSVGREAIFVVTSDGSLVTRVTEDFDIAADPSWSPDGRKIAFAGLFAYDFYYSYQTVINIVGIDGIPYSFPLSQNASNPAWRPR